MLNVNIVELTRE